MARVDRDRVHARGAVVPFDPPRWLRNPHLQTALAGFLPVRRVDGVQARWFELADGDRLRLVWAPAPVAGSPSAQPLVLLIHGLGGTARSRYLQGVICRLRQRGIDAVVLECRGASDEPNRLARAYHAAAWDDLDEVIAALRASHPQRPLLAVGYSLGGSILLNWLALRPAQSLLGAVAVSVPFELEACAGVMERGVGRIYQWHLLRRVRQLAVAKFRHRGDGPLPAAAIARLRSIRGFDEALTAPLHGFASAADYYAQASCRPRLQAIRQPTWIVHAADDPLVPASSIPTPRELPPAVGLLCQRHGGHVAFVGGRNADWHRRHWLDETVVRLLVGLLRGDAPAACAPPPPRRRRVSA
jgi:uncharacterized protein